MDDRRTVIRLNDINRVFFTDEVETHALSKVQLEVREGEFLSISGPSGSGKHTNLYATINEMNIEEEKVLTIGNIYNVHIVPGVTQIVHCIEDSAMDGLQAITHVRKCSLDDYAHRVIDERIPHFVLDETLFDPVGSVDGFHRLRCSDLGAQSRRDSGSVE